MIPEPPPGLVDALKNGNAIAIVGSGLSVASGGPSWEELILGIAAEAEDTKPNSSQEIAAALAALTEGRQLDSASMLKEILGVEFEPSVVRQITRRRPLGFNRDEFSSRFKSGEHSTNLFSSKGEVKLRNLQPTISHRILTQLNFRAIITTNYDTLLEMALPSRLAGLAVYSHSSQHILRRIKGAKPFLLKLHGDINHEEDIILAREDYSRVLFSDHVREAVRSLFHTTKAFWIGYGHRDPDLDLLLDESRAKFNLPGGYALISQGDKVTETRLKNANVSALSLPSYDDVPSFLTRAAALSGSTLVFSVTLDLEWGTQGKADELGATLARALSELEGTVLFWRAQRGSTIVYLETDPRTLDGLRSRLAERDENFMQLVRRFSIVRLADMKFGGHQRDASLLALRSSGQEVLAALRSGARVWNRWRRENKSVQSLSGADLSEFDLEGSDLGNIDLRGCRMSRKLRSASLRNAILLGVDLRSAELDHADLTGANLNSSDLSGASLRSALLTEANIAGGLLPNSNLEGAVLRRAVLAESNLEYADLSDANLSGANLVAASLRSAKLLRTNLRMANLKSADFKDAYLSGANLDRAEVSDAKLSGARLTGTNFSGLDLTEIVGLNEVRHEGQSSVSIDTLERTAKSLTNDPSRQAEIELFMRGVGLPEDYIYFFQSRLETPIRSYSCFISYSHQDQNFARRLHRNLQEKGIRSWLDQKDLRPGDRILDIIDQALRLHDKILLCCSETSLNSWWVNDEIRKAQERERRDGRDIIIPLMIDRYLLDGWEDGLAADLRSRLAADFTGWEHDNAKFEGQFERVVKALRTNEGV